MTEEELKCFNLHPEIEKYWRCLCGGNLKLLWKIETRVWLTASEKRNELLYAHWDGPFSFPGNLKGYSTEEFVRRLKLRSFE